MARRKRNPRPDPLTLAQLIEKLRPKRDEFRADSLGYGFLHKLHLTQQQRYTLLRWGSYVFICLLGLVFQDVILSRFHIFGTTLDLPAMLILLITVVEGTESGSVFVLFASVFYYFSGSAPGPYAVAALTILGMFAAVIRQAYWHRNRVSILLCACCALMLYESVAFGASIFSKLTHWGRLPRFLMTGLLSCALMIPFYPLIHKLGQIGGHTWKE